MSLEEPSPAPGVLAFRVRGDWTADDFVKFLTSLSGLYKIFLAVQIAEEMRSNIPADIPVPTPSEIYLSIGQYAGPATQLAVREASFGSPGIISLAGQKSIVDGVGRLLLDAVAAFTIGGTLAVLITKLAVSIFRRPFPRDLVRELIGYIRVLGELLLTGKLEIPTGDASGRPTPGEE